MTHAEAFANLQRELCGQPDNVPEGWLTAQQWSAEYGGSAVHTGRIIKAAVDAGKMHSSKFRIASGGRLMSIPHYRIVGAK